MLKESSLENHYQCYLKMAARRPVAILILGADCCDTVSDSGPPSLPSRMFLRPLDLAVVEDTEMCFVGCGCTAVVASPSLPTNEA